MSLHEGSCMKVRECESLPEHSGAFMNLQEDKYAFIHYSFELL
jgi:hypothetical protein